MCVLSLYVCSIQLLLPMTYYFMGRV
jgi:hypothetical protein